MIIEKYKDGSYRISGIFYGTLIIEDYYYYSKREAVKLFKKKLLEMKEKVDQF